MIGLVYMVDPNQLWTIVYWTIACPKMSLLALLGALYATMGLDRSRDKAYGYYVIYFNELCLYF